MLNKFYLHAKLKLGSNRFYTRSIICKNRLVLVVFLILVLTVLRLIPLGSSWSYIEKEPLFVFQSTCECRKWEKIIIEENLENGYSIFSMDTRDNQKKALYTLDKNELETSNFTCDLLTEFRRGKEQKVISYSLFGRDTRYFEKIGSIVKQAKELYPDWYIRIYVKDSLNESLKCSLECSPENNVDVCHVNKLVPKLMKPKIWDATYIMPAMWRFLPMGDSFVKFMLSRDLDSYIIQREIDANNAWIETGHLGHIMRDSLYHKEFILAGMWSLRLDIDAHKKLVRKWWLTLINPQLAKGYNPYPTNPKESDQIWLRHVVWAELSRYALIHDSYNCDKLMGGSPWPTRRIGDCFVGSMYGCNESAVPSAKEFECPFICRPGQHRDWKNC